MSSSSSDDKKKEEAQTRGGDDGKIKAARAREEEQEDASSPEDTGAAATAAEAPKSKKAKAVRILRKATAKQARAAAEQGVAAAGAPLPAVTWDGVAILNIKHALLDSYIIPGFVATYLETDHEKLFTSLMRNAHWTNPLDANMRHRGRPLPREKALYAVSTDPVPSLDQPPSEMPIYRYTGAQYGGLENYRDTRTLPELDNLVTAFLERLLYNGAPVETNHAILTRYRGARDNIGFHSDSMTDITPDTPIVSLSLGEEREFHFGTADPTDDKKTTTTHRFVLKSGDLFILGPQTNAAYRHAIVPVDQEKLIKRAKNAEVKPRISVVLRTITTMITREKARELAAKTKVARKIRAGEKQHKQKEKEKEKLAVPKTAGKKITTKKGGRKRGSSPSEVDNDDADDANMNEDKDHVPSKPEEEDHMEFEEEFFVITEAVIAAAKAAMNTASPAAAAAEGPWSLLGSPNAVLSNGGRTCVKQSEDLWTCATIGTVGWSSGVHQWDVHFDRLAKGLVIGIARREGINFVGSDASNAPLRHGLLCSTGHIVGGDNKDHPYLSTAVPTGATVSVFLDLDRKIVSFTLKGANAAAPAFANLGEGAWYPYFAMRFKDCTFTVTPK
jgi:alkylated DNA repair dioxygenase AlkB